MTEPSLDSFTVCSDIETSIRRSISGRLWLSGSGIIGVWRRLLAVVLLGGHRELVDDSEIFFHRWIFGGKKLVSL